VIDEWKKVELDLAEMKMKIKMEKKKTCLGSESGSDESMHGWLFSEIDEWMNECENWIRNEVPIYIANVMRNQREREREH
jgi:hypothetical protein